MGVRGEGQDRSRVTETQVFPLREEEQKRLTISNNSRYLLLFFYIFETFFKFVLFFSMRFYERRFGLEKLQQEAL